MFPPEQTYILMVAENAGIPLEDYEVRDRQTWCVSQTSLHTQFDLLIFTVLTFLW